MNLLGCEEENGGESREDLVKIQIGKTKTELEMQRWG